MKLDQLLETNTSAEDIKDYKAGEKFADWWFETGGSFSARNDPDEWSKAKLNGFFERLRKRMDDHKNNNQA